MGLLDQLFARKRKMRNVAIVGANSLLGQHLFNRLLNSPTSHQISVWTHGSKFVNRLEVNQNKPADGISYFSGMDELHSALVGCDTVFNVHEYQDFSNTPDKKMLEKHNVEYLLLACATEKVLNLVHMSSIYLQCSSWWPNVGSRELDPKRFTHDNPFPAYFNSKHTAEKLIEENDQVRSIIVRLGPLYGEGDCCSIICDAIKLSQRFGPLPVIGDLNGAVQFTYAGNACDAMMKCAEKFGQKPEIQHEIINICDTTPVRPLFDGIARDCFEASGNSLSTLSVPFWIFFPIYSIISMFGYLLNFVTMIKNPFGSLPSASYVYFLMRQWTFICDYNLRLFANYVPTYSDNEALHRSLRYYGEQLHPESIKSYSWQTSSEL